MMPGVLGPMAHEIYIYMYIDICIDVYISTYIQFQILYQQGDHQDALLGGLPLPRE